MDLQHLFFDLDGTLTHSHEGITRCIQHALASVGVTPPPLDELTQFVGPPLRDSFASLLATDDRMRLDTAMEAYRERYRAVGILENAVCPGVPELLESLTSRGRRLSVVTAKPAVFAERVLEQFALRPFFDGVYAPDLSSRPYSKSLLIRTALDATRCPPESVAMVGDRAEDIAGAREHGLHAIAVSWGYGSEQELIAANPHRTVNSPEELLAYLVGAIRPPGLKDQ